ncbi:ester cyclase [Sinomicrobium kalidii]|nr:ester cyclase [Sinomicrobium kalidii]
MDEIFQPDFVNRTVRPGFPPGSEGMSRFLTDVLWKGLSDITVEIHGQVAEGDMVSTRKTIKGKHTGVFLGVQGSGKTVAMNIMDMVRLENGKYAEHWSVMNLHDVVKQISEQ